MNEQNEETVGQALRRLSNRTSRRRLVRGLVIAVLLVVGGGTVVFVQQRQTDGIIYQARPVEQGDLVITVTATGNLAATNQVEIGSELSGIITAMNADFNDTVVQRQPLAYLDDSRYRAAVQKSQAEVAAAQAGYRQASVTRDAAATSLNRYRQSHELSGGRSPALEVLEQAEAELHRAEAAVSAAQASIAMAEASLQANESDLEKTIIYSPIDGFVLSRDVEVGQTVAASLQSPVLYTLAEDLRVMELQVDIDEADVGRVTDGQQASFTVDAYPDRQFAARIRQVRYGAVITDGVVTYQAVLDVANPDLLLRPGMTATAHIEVSRIDQALLVPNSALRYRPAATMRKREGSGSLLNALLPGPPARLSRTGQSAGAGREAGRAGDNEAILHVLGEERQPVELRVRKLATDGMLTAVSGDGLAIGIPVITNEISRQ